MIFEKQELENLIRLLASSDMSNLRLGLELLQQNPENTKACVIPLVVLSQFDSEYWDEDSEQNQEIANVLLSSHCSKALRKEHIEKLEVFESVIHYRSHRWSTFFEQLQKFEQNIDLYEPYILNNASIAYIYYELAEHLSDKYKKYGHALVYLKKLLPTEIKAARVKTSYIDILINELFLKGVYLEEVPNVLIELNALMNHYPSYIHQYYNLMGLVYDLYANDKEKAKTAYRESIKLNPQNAGALNNLANILFKVDHNVEEAYQMIKIAVKVDKKEVHYLDTLAYIELKGMNKPKKAEKTFRKIMKIRQDHHASLTGLGEALEAQGNYEEALEWYEKGLKFSKKSEYKLTKLADLLYLKLEKPEEALAHYKKIIRYYKENVHAKTMKKEITKLLKDKKN